MTPRVDRRAGDRKRRTRAVVLDVVLTGASVLIVLGIASLILTPPGRSMAVEVSDTQATAGEMVLYGTVVEDTGKPVRGATVVVTRDSTGQQVASLSSAADGTFRAALTPIADTYRIAASADVGGRMVRDTVRVDMSPGHAYGVRIELRSRDYFLFIALPSY